MQRTSQRLPRYRKILHRLLVNSAVLLRLSLLLGQPIMGLLLMRLLLPLLAIICLQSPLVGLLLLLLSTTLYLPLAAILLPLRPMAVHLQLKTTRLLLQQMMLPRTPQQREKEALWDWSCGNSVVISRLLLW